MEGSREDPDGRFAVRSTGVGRGKGEGQRVGVGELLLEVSALEAEPPGGGVEHGGAGEGGGGAGLRVEAGVGGRFGVGEGVGHLAAVAGRLGRLVGRVFGLLEPVPAGVGPGVVLFAGIAGAGADVALFRLG